ncbi:MAG: hypothetical protein WA419_14525 [Silvibacterium sp.]
MIALKFLNEYGEVMYVIFGQQIANTRIGNGMQSLIRAGMTRLDAYHHPYSLNWRTAQTAEKSNHRERKAGCNYEERRSFHCNPSGPVMH